MANGLKGFAIAYTNSSGSDEILTITGAVKFTLTGNGAGVQLWTASQATAGTRSWESSYKQTLEVDTLINLDSSSKQGSSDFLETLYIQIPDSIKVQGFVLGQSADWDVAAA